MPRPDGRRQREPAADVALAAAEHGGVDGEDERLVAGVRGARSTISFTSPRSRQAYTWNHSRPSLTARTSSMERVLSVDSVYGSPARAAARATASSPSGSAMRVKPVGASTSGYASGRPRSVDAMSTVSMPRSTRGRNVVAAKAASLAASVRSSSAAPSM